MGRRLLFFAVFLDVVIYCSHVFIFIKLIEKLVESFTLFFSHFLVVVSNADKFSALDFEAVFFEVLLQLSVAFRIALSHDRVFFLVVEQFVYTEVDEFELEFVHINAVLSLNSEHSLACEHE